MNLLLDTHYLLWSAFNSRRIPDPARNILEDQNNELWFSVASIWEVSIKAALQRVDFDVDPMVLRAGLLANGYHELDVSGGHIGSLIALPPLHRDPFDRILLAQAISEGMRLLTADSKIAEYSGPVIHYS